MRGDWPRPGGAEVMADASVERPGSEGVPPAALRAHAMQAAEVLEALGSRPEGLSRVEVDRRLEQYGPNALEAARPTSAWKILVDQLRSLVVILLFAAAIVALFLGDPLDAAAIGGVLVINTALGFFSELRARRAMEALLRLEAPQALVIREDRVQQVQAREVVPGDVVVIEAGQSVPADCRILDSNELRTNEAALTGESLPVEKRSDPVHADSPLPDRTSMLYLGTTVVAGSGRAVVVATGMGTELGRIGGLVAGIPEERTPLEHRLDALGRRLIWLALGVAALVVIVGILRGEAIGRMVETGIALAIAAVPEGLPAVSTIALAAGVHRMARRRALVRRLPAVEALGSATVVCTDKTGTLTAGEMTMTTLWAGDQVIEVTGIGYAPEGEFMEDGSPVDPEDEPILELALRTAVLASRGGVEEKDGTWEPRGDPTDVALLVAGLKAGVDREQLLEQYPQVGEVPFSSERKFLASFHRDPDGRISAYVKGAPRVVLDRSATVLGPEGERPLDEGRAERILRANDELASRGLRILALAHGTVEEPSEDALKNLAFIGLVGIIDPPASGVAETIERFRMAGIRTVMLTGDQRLTAEAVARQLGVLAPGEESLDGRELARLGGDELAERLGRVGVFSRVSPESKLTIVDGFQRRGEIVAMLGDGVNDAAALKKADIGVAMGIRGTDVAKEAAALVLQDDRFQTIGAAVEEGRVIFDNIRKFVFYLFSCNLAEVLVLLVAGLLGLPVPLLPLQILWLNLVTDTFPALALAFEPAEPDLMRRPPRDPQAAILSGAFLWMIAIYAAMITVVSLAGFAWGLRGAPVTTSHAVTITFMTLALAQILHLANARSIGPVVSGRSLVSNRYAIGAVVLTVGLQLVAVYWTPLRSLLRLESLYASDWLVIVPLAVAPAAIGQLYKLLCVRGRRSP